MRHLHSLLPIALVLAGCATPQNNYDPLESINRPIYSFNDAVDKAVLKPAAQGWSAHVPDGIQKGVHNFFGNIDDLFGIPAALLQGKWHSAGQGTGRVVLNSTFGLGGLIDIGSDVPFKKQDEDFGQMLGYWGIPSGPYLMVPLYGPLTLRDSVDPAARLAWGPIDYIEPLAGQIGYYGVAMVNLRAELLPLDGAVQDALDPYVFVRDAYLQRRWFKVHDGEPPHPLPMAADAEDDDDIEQSSAAGTPAP